jgi:hypothetical protein
MNEDQRNDDEMKGSRSEKGARAPDAGETPGEERRADLTTSANQEIAEAHADDSKDGGTATRLEQLADPADSIDEHMPAGSESPEDKVNDIINSGILRR